MKRKFLTLMTVLLVLLIAISIVACADYTEPDDGEETEDEITRTQIVTNGTFYNASSSSKDAYIKETVSGWTATKGSLATSANGVTMGVIDLADTSAYDLNKDKFAPDEGTPFDNPGVDPATPKDTDDQGNPIDELQDTNALVIASKATAGSLYYKNSSSFTLEAGKYYLLQYSVCTNIDYTDVSDDDKDKKGAWVHITGGVEYVDSCIDTEGKWETRYLYIESNKLSGATINIRLWLGNGPAKISNEANPYATKGAVMFDNIICKEVTTASDETYNGGNVVTLDHDVFTAMAANAIANDSKIGYESIYYLSDLKLEQTTETTPTSTNAINYYYSFREGVYTSTNVNNYTLVKGKEGLSSSDYPTVTNAYTGIVDLSRLYASDATSESTDTYSELLPSSYSFTAPSFDDWKNKIMNGTGHNMNSLDETKALMIYHNDLSGAGFTNKSTLTIESNKYYVISVWVYVWVPVDENGNFAYPTANAPDKPTEYTEAQSVLVGYYNDESGEGQLFYGYFNDLTEEEKAIVDGDAPASVTPVADIEVLVKTEAFLTALKAVYDEKVADNFVYKYLYDNMASYVAAGSIAEGDADYIKYRYLTERSSFIKNTWSPVKTLMDKWAQYDEDYTEYMAKYTVWANNNPDGPYAKVKLSGAGDDIEMTTSSYNSGWEQINFYIQGNQISDRNLTLEFWYGEGAATEYDNLMFGGAFFDDITIKEISEEDKDNNYADKNWEILSPLTTETELSYGGLNASDDWTNAWEYELAEGTASSDVEKISVSKAKNEDIGTVKLENGTVVDLYELIFKNTQPTASILKTKNALTVKPNTAYRFAMWVKTTGIAEGKGVTIDLMAGSDEAKLDEFASVANIATFNSEEWQEVVFYIMGDTIKTNYVSLKFTMGTGTRFSTDTFVQGDLHVSVINCTEIKYSEYSASSKSGDQVKSYAFANTAAATDSVTNGSFSGLDYDDTDEKEFDENGNLTGVGTTSDWTVGTVKNNTFNTVEISGKPVSDASGETKFVISWAPVVGVDKEGNDTEPTSYEIYARSLDDDNKSVERLLAVIAADKNDASIYKNDEFYYNIDMTGKRTTSFRVRAVSDNGVSNYSNYYTPSVGSTGGDMYVTEDSEASGKKEYTVGTVLNSGLFDNSDYKSPYSTALKITSNYNIALKVTSASKSLDANSYYVVSVWVRTEDGAKASVTVSNISNVLTANVGQNYVGYSGIDTQGKWTQYRFYIKTGASSSSLSLELALGNSYAIKSSKKSDSVTSAVAVYDTADLSQGTVYFDGVWVRSIEEKEYNAQLEKGEYNEDDTVRLHDFSINEDNNLYDPAKNRYAIRNLVYTADSFDSFTENTTSEGSDGYNLGHTPNNYDWAKAGDATGTTENERMYGVYNYAHDADEKLSVLYEVTDDEESTVTNVFEDFMPADFDIRDFIQMDGYNSLVMSNKIPYGQSYTTESSITINATTYYKLTFKAKTLIAKEVEGDDDVKTYVTEGVNAEFRFMQHSSSTSYQSILINSNGRTDDIYEAVEYTLYIYNPSSTSSSAKWAFYLGDDADDEDTTGTKQFLMGMMVIDQVALTSISEEDFNAAKASFDALTESEQASSAVKVFSYDEDEPVDNEKEEDPETTPEETPSIWEGGQGWLLISSIVIGAVIIVVVVVVVIRTWKKKHPKEVVGENVVKTEKDIKVVVQNQEKVETVVDDEYSDEVVKPVYVQRVTNKKKGKNKKKKR